MPAPRKLSGLRDVFHSFGHSVVESLLYPPLLPRDIFGYGAGSEISEEPALYRRPMSDQEWRQVLLMLRERVSVLDKEKLGALVHHSEERLRWLDAAMARYCEATCPSCEDPCCHGRQVFYNRTDLLWLLALGREWPPGQTRQLSREPCRYLLRDGCGLSRALRPYVCVWFLCDAQMGLLREEPAIFQRHFVRILEEMRMLRLRLESLYRHHSRAEDDLAAPHGP